MLVVITIITLIILLFSYFNGELSKYVAKLDSLRKLHCLPGASFLTGHISLIYRLYDAKHSFGENIGIIASKFAAELRDKSLVVTWLAWSPIVVVTNAEVARHLLSFNNLLNKSPFYRFTERVLGVGLLNSEPEKWKKLRKLMNPAFHARLMEEYLAIMNEQATILVDVLSGRRKEMIDVKNVLPLMTLEIIYQTLLRFSVDAQRTADATFTRPIHLPLDVLVAKLANPLTWFDLIGYRIISSRKAMKEVNEFHELSRCIAVKRMDEILSNLASGHLNLDENEDGENGSRKSFIDILLRKHLRIDKSDGELEFSFDDVCAEIKTIILAGFDTSATALAWTLHLLGNHKDIQDKAYEEVFSIFGTDKKRHVTVDDISRLKYVGCCIKEALRLYPPVPYFLRKTSEDVTVCGHTIPAGVSIAFPVFDLHRDPKYFPQPFEFIPERFLEKQININDGYMPFSAGPRNCIGQRFAMYEMKTVVANILRNFVITSETSTKDIMVSFDVVTTTKHPLNILFEPRS